MCDVSIARNDSNKAEPVVLLVLSSERESKELAERLSRESRERRSLPLPASSSARSSPAGPSKPSSDESWEHVADQLSSSGSLSADHIVSRKHSQYASYAHARINQTLLRAESRKGVPGSETTTNSPLAAWWNANKRYIPPAGNNLHDKETGSCSLAKSMTMPSATEKQYIHNLALKEAHTLQDHDSSVHYCVSLQATSGTGDQQLIPAVMAAVTSLLEHQDVRTSQL
ncbi:hypothetical protein CEUSTIGMA_g10687.t1 [Chlamydomonas eustigma]|uniref:Uncharacterized protein n=1 Tax=Chlamydomonas eustigma TaxID=1157962 RepID=A0A250XJJ4_9CHLO|nr:hypothetical protein CEUSTIGMA_g10687.t1 [Chlamydomonas eustigma]|eukprot:GAX83261.1 hypothetical protein CEUSTIGMA_g10687.t1 [Chlamydomonas eustigma]